MVWYGMRVLEIDHAITTSALDRKGLFVVHGERRSPGSLPQNCMYTAGDTQSHD